MASNDTQIIGYAQPWIVSPGQSVDIKISSTEKEYRHRLVRLLQGYRGPHGPPVAMEEITEVPAGHRDDGCFQSACPGSYAVVPSWASVEYKDEEGINIEFYAQPYLLENDSGCQTLLSCLDTDSRTGFAVILKDSTFRILIGTGHNVEVIQSHLLVNRWRWLQISLSIINKMVTVSIHQLIRLSEQAPKGQVMTKYLSAPMVLGSNELLFGAGMFDTVGQKSSEPSCFYNGRLDSLCFAMSQSPRRVVAKYDFSKNISSDTIEDVSGNARNGILINAPTRAVKGYNWDGSQPDWTKA